MLEPEDKTQSLSAFNFLTMIFCLFCLADAVVIVSILSFFLPAATYCIVGVSSWCNG